MKHLSLIILLSLKIFSCQKKKISGKIKKDAEFAQELRNSLESLTINDNQLVLSTYLWRDFMPSPDADGNGSKMICVNTLSTTDSVSILSSIQLKKQYIIKGNEIWTADYSEFNQNQPFEKEGIVREGPKWGPDITVDVVCEFENNGTVYRIISKNQLIHKTS